MDFLADTRFSDAAGRDKTQANGALVLKRAAADELADYRARRNC